MARGINKLTDRQLKAWVEKGTTQRLGDGGGLYASRNQSGSIAWIFLYIREGKRKVIGLGSLRDVSLADARKQAEEHRKVLATGGDPVETKAEAKREANSRKTFGEVAKLCAAEQWEAGTWKNESQRDEFLRVSKVYLTDIESLPIGDVGVSDVAAVVRKWRTERPTMASFAASVARRVCDFAVANGWRSEDRANPADPRLLEQIAKVNHSGGHFSALSWEDVPAFYVKLCASTDVRARAARLLLLTVPRKMECLALQWHDVDFDAATMTIEAERLKMGRRTREPHVIPLCDEAIAILRLQYDATGGKGYVFPAVRRRTGHLPSTALIKHFEGYGTPHGTCRAAFRSWCEDHGIDPTLAERALAHTSKLDSTQKAYRRTTALALRRKLMSDWCAHVTSALRGQSGGTDPATARDTATALAGADSNV